MDLQLAETMNLNMESLNKQLEALGKGIPTKENFFKLADALNNVVIIMQNVATQGVKVLHEAKPGEVQQLKDRLLSLDPTSALQSAIDTARIGQALEALDSAETKLKDAAVARRAVFPRIRAAETKALVTQAQAIQNMTPEEAKSYSAEDKRKAFMRAAAAQELTDLAQVQAEFDQAENDFQAAQTLAQIAKGRLEAMTGILKLLEN
ncbi:MAG: hypothetical protein WA118_08145 [Carboxydocellales bacterium]